MARKTSMKPDMLHLRSFSAELLRRPWKSTPLWLALLCALHAFDRHFFSGATATHASMGIQFAVGFFVLLLIVGLGGIAYVFYLQRQEEIHRENQTLNTAEGSPFEQILAEVQGINLAIQNGTGHQFGKLKRLVRIFIERIGVQVKPGMTFDELQDALVNASLSPKQIQMLSSVLDRCERGEAMLEDEKPDFDPLDLIKDFKYIIGQIDGRSYIDE